MGLSNRQILSKIELPLAIPVILTGIRQAVVLSVGIAAVAAYIGGGGLGRWIFGGIRRTYPDMILAGGLAVSLMAIGIDVLLRKVQIWLTQKC
jgi:osmoprotectant transport system permease protein